MLANFRGQLGEPMQIHEITKKTVAEASVAGFAGGTAAALGGIANQLGKQFATKVLGTDTTSAYGDAQSREQGFQNLANSAAAQQLAATMQKAWQETVQNFMARSKDSNGNPPTDLSQVTQPSIATLKSDLVQLVNNMLGRQGGDYKNLANTVGDPQQKQYTAKIVTDIDKSVDAIYNATMQNTDAKATANLFTELVGMGILPAQNILAYDTGSRGGARSGGTNRLDADAQRMATLAGLNTTDVAELQHLASNPANRPALLKVLGIPPA